ncbi:hypothetical protein FACS1894195_5300 [Bacteroidia bacterium]|nr:hypothetical protein FACS1894195_5300 [Bacteroidia bacterium]
MSIFEVITKNLSDEGPFNGKNSANFAYFGGEDITIPASHCQRPHFDGGIIQKRVRMGVMSRVAKSTVLSDKHIVRVRI